MKEPNLIRDDLRISPHLVEQDLPRILQECLSVASTPAAKDMLLLSILTTTSVVFNNYYFRYGLYGKRYYPNLQTFIMAGPASGKGVCELATKLVRDIESERTLLIPGDSTFPAFFSQLSYQDGIGLLFETEGDVITQIWKNDCSNYNVALRKAAEHESLTKSRVAFTAAISKPRVSVLLSGTFKQFKRLVPSIENGYFSRITPLVVRDTSAFCGSAFFPQQTANKDTDAIFSYWGRKLYDWFNPERPEVEFLLSQSQSQQIGQIMEKEYPEFIRIYGGGFHSVLTRNGVLFYRIACVLSLLRLLDSPYPTATFGCDPEDFRSALVISTKLLLNSADAFTQISGQKQEIIPEAPKGCQQTIFFATLPDQFSTIEFLLHGDEMGIDITMLKTWLADWLTLGLIKHPSAQEYVKC